MASDREFLRGNRAPTPELMPGVDDSNGIKYKRAEDLSDSDEAEMDMSDDEDGERGECRIAPQRAERVAKVLQHALQRRRAGLISKVHGGVFDAPARRMVVRSRPAAGW